MLYSMWLDRLEFDPKAVLPIKRMLQLDGSV